MVNKEAIVSTFIYTLNVREGLKMYNMNSEHQISESTYRKYLKVLIAEQYNVNYTEWTQRKTTYTAKKLTQADRLKAGFSVNKHRNYNSHKRNQFSKSAREYIFNKYNYKCAWEGCTETFHNTWEGDIDHINGDHSDGRMENLRVLCPKHHRLYTLQQRGITATL